MYQVITDIKLDVNSNNNPTVVAKQHDYNTRFIRAKIVDRENEIRLNEDNTYFFTVVRKDGKKKNFACVLEERTNTLLLPLNYWTLEYKGFCDAEVSIVDEESKLTTAIFKIKVTESLASNEQIEKDDSFDLLVLMINDAKKIKESADNGDFDGADGKSAYEIAVEQGYKGTAEDWIKSLQGEKGDKGDSFITIKSPPSPYRFENSYGYKYILPKSTVNCRVGDTLRYSTFLYPVLALESTTILLGDYTSLKGDKGNVGEIGPSGADGKSAYDIAVEQGYTGTAEEWIDSLKGRGLQPDYDQNDETAEDYIKNRPFYKKSESYTFPNADYEHEIIEGTGIYRISEEIPEIAEGDNIVVSYRSQDSDIVTNVELRNNEVDFYEGLIEFWYYIIVTSPMPLDDEIVIPVGIYTFPDDNGTLYVLEKLTVNKIKTIDKKFLPYSNMWICTKNMEDLFIYNEFKTPPFAIYTNTLKSVFLYCKNLEECCVNPCPPFSQPNLIQNLAYAFRGCEKLKSIYGNLSLHKDCDCDNAFLDCYELQYIEDIYYIFQDIAFPNSTKLTNETVNKILRALKYSDTKHTLVLPSNIVDRLTEEQWALIPSNWVLG